MPLFYHFSTLDAMVIDSVVANCAVILAELLEVLVMALKPLHEDAKTFGTLDLMGQD